MCSETTDATTNIRSHCISPWSIVECIRNSEQTSRGDRSRQGTERYRARVDHTYSPAVRARALGVTLVVVLGVPAVLGAAEPPDVRLGVTVDPEEQRAFGRVSIRFANQGRAAMPAAYVWLYPNRLRHPPAGLDETNWYSVYPVEFDAGWIRVSEVKRDGAAVPDARLTQPRPHLAPEGTLLRIPLDPPLPPGARATVEMRFETRIPERFGLLGQDGDRTVLAAPFYPVLAAQGPDGFDLEAPADDARWNVLLTVPSERDVLIDGEHSPGRSGAPGWRRVGWVGSGGEPALLVFPPLDVARTRHHGVTLEVLTTGGRYRSPERRATRPMAARGMPERMPDWIFLDEPALTLDAMRLVVEVLQGVGLGPAPDEPLRVVEVPERMRLAIETPGAVMASDRLYRILPLERTRRFHTLELMRALFASVLLERLGREQDPRDRYWACDTLANALVELWIARRTGGAETARDLLGFASFHPAVDQLLYAPQIAFAEAYFGTIEETDPLREEPWRFANELPRGRRVLAKIRDLVSPAEYERFLRLALTGGVSVREALATATGRPMDDFFQTWLGAYPSVNYRIAAHASRRLAGGGYMARVAVERRGADIVEPVSVRVVDEAGETHDLRWDGRGHRGVVTARTRAPIDEIVVDPAGRLVEDPDLTANHPRLDNLDPAPWRPPILNAASLELSVTEVQPDLILDFSARRQYDLRRSIGVGFHSTARGIGGNVRYFQGFGAKRTLNSSEWFLGGVLSFDRLSADFANFGEPGSSIGVTGILYRDTRRFVWDPWFGSSFSIGLGPSVAILDDGEVSVSAAATTRWTHLWTPAPGRTLALFAGAGIGLGDLQPHEEQTIAGRSLLRSYEVDEARGRLRLYGIAEYRHTLVKSLGWNFVHLAWIRGLQLAAFAGAGLVSPDVDLGGLVTRHSLYTEVGGGVRIHFDYFGVQPSLLSIDVGVPLSRTAFDWVDDCAIRDQESGRCDAIRPSWSLRIGFDQTL